MKFTKIGMLNPQELPEHDHTSKYIELREQLEALQLWEGFSFTADSDSQYNSTRAEISNHERRLGGKQRGWRFTAEYNRKSREVRVWKVPREYRRNTSISPSKNGRKAFTKVVTDSERERRRVAHNAWIWLEHASEGDTIHLYVHDPENRDRIRKRTERKIIAENKNWRISTRTQGKPLNEMVITKKGLSDADQHQLL